MYDKKSPPDALAHKFEPETFQKSQVYGKDKAWFSLISSAYDQTLEVLLLYFDAQAWAWTLAGSVLEKRGYEGYEVCLLISSTSVLSSPDYSHMQIQIAHSIVFLGILLLLGGIPSLPFQYYQTFVLEQKHGFNKSTVKLFITDTLKGWALAAIIGGPFMAAFLWIIKWAGDGFIPWLMSFLYVPCFRDIVLSSVRRSYTCRSFQGRVPAHHGRFVSTHHPTSIQQAVSAPRRSPSDAH